MPVFFRNKSGSARSRKMHGNKPCQLATSLCCTRQPCASNAYLACLVVQRHPTVEVQKVPWTACQRLPLVCVLFGSDPMNLLLQVPPEGFLRFLTPAQVASGRAPHHDLCPNSPCLSFQYNQAMGMVLPHPVYVANQTWWATWLTHHTSQTFSSWADVVVEGTTKVGFFFMSFFFPWQCSCALKNEGLRGGSCPLLLSRSALRVWTQTSGFSNSNTILLHVLLIPSPQQSRCCSAGRRGLQHSRALGGIQSSHLYMPLGNTLSLYINFCFNTTAEGRRSCSVL